MTPLLSTSEQATRAERFLVLHRPGAPLLMPNAWDVGSARLFASVGMEAIATTSGGFAASRGRLDGAMTAEEVLEHCGDLAEAVGVPVSGDLENCFAQDPDGVADFIAAAKQRGLAGGSIEDYTRNAGEPIYELGEATERVRAAADAAHAGPIHFVLTARAENYLHGRVNLGDTITRLQAYQEAGADVLFAPRVVEPAELRQVLAAVDIPVSVLVTPKAPPIHELAELGVSRISVGGAIAAATYGFAVEAVKELQQSGRANYWERAGATREAMVASFVKP